MDEKILKIRHSLSHVMALAVKRIYKDVKVAIGPAIDNGFYYDFDFKTPIKEDDLPKIEDEMINIINENQDFIREEWDKNKAREYFTNLGENFKVELIDGLTDDTVWIYKNGEFVDLCKGPHVSNTKELRSVGFKLSSIAGAYWRGSEKNPMLTRIYAFAFETKKELNDYIRFLQEAAKRDHRVLAKQLDLYSINENVGPGLVLWHPNGAMIRYEIENFWRERHLKNGYQFVNTPHIGRENLWMTSGHLGFYKDSMYAPMKIDEINYYAKPMNCPFHIEIYKSKTRSYRDLPLRWAELGTVYRFEKAGVLHGLTRVRGFTQDDAHLFCTQEQMESEVLKVLNFSLKIWDDFGFKDIKAYISTKPADSIGSEDMWRKAEKSLVAAVEKENLKYEVDEGGGAFYGPKIDLKIKDALGREWQTTTIQFDFNEPERFEMEYSGADGKLHRPYMIHRALLGSLERFFGILIEHYAGAFPSWLSPVQVYVMDITTNEEAYTKAFYERLVQEGIRAKIDLSTEPISGKIKSATTIKPPYIVIIGKKEVEKNVISLKIRGNKNVNDVNPDDFISKIKNEIQERRLTTSY
ncbi:MAG: threonine--tRNA ligase [Elusimicrobia bacterium]|jgi:threonyl-tRNA synthetase|nr:threonine--tRNA ligase [Elusimicrobiota bacterium]